MPSGPPRSLRSETEAGVLRGIVEATKRLGYFPQKLVVRLDGTNAEEGRRILEEAALPNVISKPTMQEAAAEAVRLASA